MRAIVVFLCSATLALANPLIFLSGRPPVAAPSGVNFSDNFNRADSTNLGANWTEASGDAEIVSNIMRLMTGGYADNFMIYTGTATSTVDQYVKFTIEAAFTADARFPCVVFRYTNTSTPFYVVFFNVNGDNLTWQRYATTAGAATVIETSGTLAIATGDIFGVTISGTGTATVVRVWKTPTGDIPTSESDWGGDTTPDISFTVDPASAVNTGNNVGIGGEQQTGTDTQPGQLFRRRCTMKKFVITILFIVLTSLTQAQTTRPTNGTSTDVQAKINASIDGDIVTIPSGSFPWTSGVTISGKGITVRGEGAGRVEGSSTSSVAIGTGSKSFTVTNTITGFTPGETITARYKPAGTNFMTGTVTSWNGTTLVLNVTSVGGSGTRAVWNFEAPASTTLTGAGASFSITEDATHRVELTGIRFAGSAGETVVVDAGGLGVLLHDLRFTRTSGRNIRMRTNKGILWHLYMDTGFAFGASEQLTTSGVAFKGGPASSWTTVSAMGTGDTTGEGKVYLEDSYFAGLLTETLDFDDNCRAAVRHCVFDNSGLSSHGADTSGEGNRYFEIYDNVGLFHDLGNDTANMDYWLYLRGGTGSLPAM